MHAIQQTVTTIYLGEGHQTARSNQLICDHMCIDLKRQTEERMRSEILRCKQHLLIIISNILKGLHPDGKDLVSSCNYATDSASIDHLELALNI